MMQWRKSCTDGITKPSLGVFLNQHYAWKRGLQEVKTGSSSSTCIQINQYKNYTSNHVQWSVWQSLTVFKLKLHHTSNKWIYPQHLHDKNHTELNSGLLARILTSTSQIQVRSIPHAHHASPCARLTGLMYISAGSESTSSTASEGIISGMLPVSSLIPTPPNVGRPALLRAIMAVKPNLSEKCK